MKNYSFNTLRAMCTYMVHGELSWQTMCTYMVHAGKNMWLLWAIALNVLNDIWESARLYRYANRHLIYNAKKNRVDTSIANKNIFEPKLYSSKNWQTDTLKTTQQISDCSKRSSSNLYSALLILYRNQIIFIFITNLSVYNYQIYCGYLLTAHQLFTQISSVRVPLAFL